MSRSSVYDALTLSVRSFGEANREALFLSAESGLLRAAVYGGPKSKLRAHVSPFHRGKLYVYHDPVRDSRKVVDFDVRSWKPGLRESLDRSLAAAAIVETVALSQGGGGDWATALEEADSSLEACSEAEDTAVPLVLARFFWVWTSLLGSQPELERCSRCACAAAGDEVLWYSRLQRELLCGRCVPEGDRGLRPLQPGSRRWLGAVSRTDPRSALRIGLADDAVRNVGRFVMEVLSDAMETWPRSWSYLEERT